MKIRPLGKRVIVSFMERGERKLGSGIVLPSDDGKETGIRPRWAQVYAMGEGVPDINVGDWVLIEHGRWTRGLTIRDGDENRVLYQVDWENGILASADEPPFEFDT
jgi:co-chaperonin GroES (HSP10)